MKFITEDELRYLYRQEPFTTSEPEPGTRLTPGARQFLLDRGIDMYDEEKKAPVIRESLTQEVCCPSANPGHNGGGTQGSAAKGSKKGSWRTKMVRAKLASVEAVFLQTEASLLKGDVLLAQSLSTLGKQFSDIRRMVEGKGVVLEQSCKECSGMNSGNITEDLGDCFEITEFHVQLENGSQILALHQLRCALREIEPVLLQAFEGNEAATGPCADAIGKINQIINTVSQLICGAVGGKECQRKP